MTKGCGQFVVNLGSAERSVALADDRGTNAAARHGATDSSAGFRGATRTLPERDRSDTSSEEADLEEDLDEEFQLPDMGLRGPLDAEAEWVDEAPRYADLLDSDWIDRKGQVESLEDDRSGLLDLSLDTGVTLDITGADMGDEGAQVVDLDVGPALTSVLRDSSEADKKDVSGDRSLFDSALGVAALQDLLITNDPSDPGADEAVGDDDRFPVFDESGVPRSRLDDDDVSDRESTGDEES